MVICWSCLQKEAAIPSQVLSRVLDSRVQTTSQNSFPNKFDSRRWLYTPTSSRSILNIISFISNQLATFTHWLSDVVNSADQIYCASRFHQGVERLINSLKNKKEKKKERVMSVASMNMPHHLFTGYPFQGKPSKRFCPIQDLIQGILYIIWYKKSLWNWVGKKFVSLISSSLRLDKCLRLYRWYTFSAFTRHFVGF
jgi:hypothetical protein